nr:MULTISPECIES: cyclophane-forming radical SAM/SPASM peptide maturase GrrM/OscB [Phaeobacter]
MIQSTPFCNLNCTYCYLPSRHIRGEMKLDVVEKVFGNIFKSNRVEGQLTIVWHAGEPLVLSPDYYDRAFEMIRSAAPKGLEIIHSFQTNATIVNDRIVDLIKKWDVKVGVSIDGPEHIHDRFRKDRSGKGTFSRVVSGIRYLKECGLDLSAICVLSDYSLDYADEIFDFFVSEGIDRVAFNVEEIEGENTASTLNTCRAYDRHWRFMSRFWNRSIKEGKISVLRELEEAVLGVIRPQGTVVHNSLVEPFSILNIDIMGNASSYSPEFLGFKHEKYGDFCFGNLAEADFSTLLESEVYKALTKDVQDGVTACKDSCQYFSVCGGGAPANKLWENGTVNSTETMFCNLTKKLPTDLAICLIDSVGAEKISQLVDKEKSVSSDNAIRPFT